MAENHQPEPVVFWFASEETIREVWQALMRYVPHRSKDTAWSLANVIHLMLTNNGIQDRIEAERAAFEKGLAYGEERSRAQSLEDAYQRGFAMGVTAGRTAERSAQIGLTSGDDEPITTKH